jgi:hypothetical protein
MKTFALKPTLLNANGSGVKAAFTNASGNTGKTTLAKHLGAPLLGARRVQIEDLNAADGSADIEIASKRFKELAAELAVADDEAFVIDIGASTFQAVTEHFAWLDGIRELIDYWVIPVVPSVKVKKDSIATAKTLVEIGVPPERIVMLLNNVTEPEEAHAEFAQIFALRNLGMTVCEQAVLANELFDELKDSTETIFDLAADETDFTALKAAARAADDADELRRIGKRMVQIMAAKATAKNLRAVFDAMPFSAVTA